MLYLCLETFSCLKQTFFISVLTEHFFFNTICNQAQKELLDAELDFHKKMSSGEDTTDLKRKLGQLQVEVTNAHTHTHYTDQNRATEL